MGGSVELARSGMGETHHRLYRVPQIKYEATFRKVPMVPHWSCPNTHTKREGGITTEPIDGGDPKSPMYINEAPESTPNTKLWERQEANRETSIRQHRLKPREGA